MREFLIDQQTDSSDVAVANSRRSGGRVAECWCNGAQLSQINAAAVAALLFRCVLGWLNVALWLLHAFKSE